MPDPLEPAHIPGQNPNTPERLQGEMTTASRRSGWLVILIPFVVVIALLAAFVGMRGVNPENVPHSSSEKPVAGP
jgi:hypothetical protein